MIEYLSRTALKALGHIETAHRLGSPLDRNQLKARLGYRSRGAVDSLVIALVEAGVVKVDKRVFPSLLRPVSQSQEAA